jgi:3-methyladenine DNA glycosylase/8-oxoguanine DNA glycosylase
MNDKVIQLRPTPAVPDTAPDFITRKAIDTMTDQQLDQMLDAIRMRRLANYIVYKQTVDEKNSINSERAKEKVEAKADMIFRTLLTLDKQFDKLEKYVNELRGLRIQAGMYVI